MSEPLKFYLLTDLHHYASCFGNADNMDQKCMTESGAIIDAAVDLLCADKNTNIVLIAGDISNNGEHQSHEEVIEKLYRLKDAGKRVFAITATHDYNTGWLQHYDEDIKPGAPLPTEREELLTLYKDFGLNEARAFEPKSHCYCVQLAEGYRLLCLNDDGDGREFCGYFDDTLAWIKQQADEAKRAGDTIFAMTHHPVIPPSVIYPAVSRRDMLGDYEKTAEKLADWGIEFIFTGHTHMMNIALKTSAKGNKLYDINTSSVVGYPPCIRLCSLDEEKMDVKTIELEDFDWDRGGKTVSEYMQAQFDRLLTTLFYSAAYDIDTFAGLAGGFSVERETVYKYKTMISLVGKIVYKMTIGDLARLMCISHKTDPSIKKIKIRDIVPELIRNVWYGDEPYTPGTPLYEFVAALCDRLRKYTRRFDKNGSIAGLLAIAPQILYDEPPADRNAVLMR